MPPLLFCRFICQFAHLSLYTSHMFYKHRDTIRTHRCPVRLVPLTLSPFLQDLADPLFCRFLNNLHSLLFNFHQSLNSIFIQRQSFSIHSLLSFPCLPIPHSSFNPMPIRLLFICSGSQSQSHRIHSYSFPTTPPPSPHYRKPHPESESFRLLHDSVH